MKRSELKNYIALLVKEQSRLEVAAEIEKLKIRLEKDISDYNLMQAIKNLSGLERLKSEFHDQLLQGYIEDARSKIVNALEQAVPNLFVISKDSTTMMLTVSDSVPFGLPDSKSFVNRCDILTSADKLGILEDFENHYVNILSEDIIPVLTEKAELTVGGNSLVIDINNAAAGPINCEALFSLIVVFLDFTYNLLIENNEISHSHVLQNSWLCLRKMLECNLQYKILAADFEMAKHVQNSAKQSLETFKAATKHMGISYLEVELFINQLLDAFVANRGNALLQNAISIIPQLYSSEMTSVEEKIGFFKFPACSIHSGIQNLVHLLDEIAHESNNASSGWPFLNL